MFDFCFMACDGDSNPFLQVLIDFPFQILFGYYAAKWSSGDRPLRPVWMFSALADEYVDD